MACSSCRIARLPSAVAVILPRSTANAASGQVAVDVFDDFACLRLGFLRFRMMTAVMMMFLTLRLRCSLHMAFGGEHAWLVRHRFSPDKIGAASDAWEKS